MEGCLDEPPQNENRRRDRRVYMRVPVTVHAAGPDGNLLEEETHTGVIGIVGAMVRMSRELKIGSELDLTNRFSQRTARFRVAWTKAPAESGLWEIGIESLEPLGDFWGGTFPSPGGLPVTVTHHPRQFVVWLM
jgi:hypothetical protein